MHSHSKKTAKRLRSVKKSVKINSKKARASQSAHGEGGLFPAINLLHDPQGTAEKVFRRLRQSKQRFEVMECIPESFVLRPPIDRVGVAPNLFWGCISLLCLYVLLVHNPL